MYQRTSIQLRVLRQTANIVRFADIGLGYTSSSLCLVNSNASESLKSSHHVVDAFCFSIANNEFVPLDTAVAADTVSEERNYLGGVPSLVNRFEIEQRFENLNYWKIRKVVSAHYDDLAALASM